MSRLTAEHRDPTRAGPGLGGERRRAERRLCGRRRGERREGERRRGDRRRGERRRRSRRGQGPTLVRSDLSGILSPEERQSFWQLFGRGRE